MKKIWKYKYSEQMELPQDAKIIKVGVQRGTWYIWVIIDPHFCASVYTTYRRFRIIATGQEYDPEGLKYITTFFQCDGELVWHLFEKTYREETK